MTSVVESLVLDLVEWVAKKPRTYSEVMEAWRTSCPRLPVWEDAVDRGLVAHQQDGTIGIVVATPAGRSLLAAHGRMAQSAEWGPRRPNS